MRKIEENSLLFSAKFAGQKDYWLNKLPAALPGTFFFCDYGYSLSPGSPGTGEMGEPGEKAGQVNIAITDSLSQKLLKLGKGSDLSLYIILLAAVKILVYRYTDNEDLGIISPVYTENMTEETINDLLLIYDRMSGFFTFKELLINISQSVLEAYENQDYPFAKLMKIRSAVDYDDDGDDNRQNNPDRGVSNIECLLKNIHLHNEPPTATPGRRLVFSFAREENRVTGAILFNGALYEKCWLEEISAHFVTILANSLNDVNVNVFQLSFLSPRERHRLLYEFNRKEAEIPGGLTVYHYLARQGETTPDRVALAFEDKELTYKHLNREVNRWAGILKEKGIQKDQPVGILLERTPLMPIGILAVWKTGGAYIPIDAEEPFQRTAEILNDSDAGVLITQSQYISAELAAGYRGSIIKADEQPLEMEAKGNSPRDGLEPDLAGNINNAAYIIYTSGSTGKPKGAMVEHLGMMNHLYAKISELHLAAEDTVAQNSTHTFDISVWQFFAALTLGGKTVIYSNRIVMEPDRLIEKVIAAGITILEVVPSYLSVLMDFLELRPREFKTLRQIVVTGEAVLPPMVTRWFAKFAGINIINAYGPTEASDDITHHIMDKPGPGERIPLGKPIQNLRIYIIDRYMNLCPLGVKGEIAVSGIGVGRGYLNNPELTADKFIMIDNNFKLKNGRDTFQARLFTSLPASSHLASLPRHAILYKTGDLGRWLPGGTIEFFGRMDHQVKIRGYRIELGEIEDKLSRFPRIKNALVIDRQDKQGSSYLCAYIVPHRTGRAGISEIRDYLARVLPEYMIPAHIVELEQLPVTANGKVDRKTLPNPLTVKKEMIYEPPTNKVEEKILAIWSEVLGLEKEKIGIDANFFAMGGDSIKAIQISARMQKYRLKVEIRDLFLNPTIKQLAGCVKKMDRVIDQGLVQGEVKLSPIQRWFFETGFTGNHHFNQAVMIYSKFGFDENIIRHVLKKITLHHDALRMIYIIAARNVSQLNRGPEGVLFDLNVFDLSNRERKEEIQKEIEKEAAAIQGGIDLTSGPLLKTGLFKTPAGDHLLFVIHHLVVDGVSWRILLEDFAIGYRQVLMKEEIKFQEKTDSFKYWLEKLTDYSQGKEILKEVGYWKRLEETAVDKLPRDNEINRAKRKNKYNKNVLITLPGSETGKLTKEAHRAYNTNTNDILLTGLALSLQEWGGMEQILINLEGHGREEIIEDVNISRTVGWFTSQYPLLLAMGKRSDLPSAIKHVKETLRQVPNGGIAYGILRYLLPPERTEGLIFRHEPSISFNYMGELGQEALQEHSGIGPSTLSPGETLGPEAEMIYSIDINGGVNEGKLNLAITYNQLEYQPGNIEKLAALLRLNLLKLIDHCVNKEESELTVSDFSSSAIDEEDLESIFSELAGES